MRARPPDKEPFEHAKESVMLRTMEGTINFWNHSAEDLYGWRKDDAVGRISHELLNTQFPKPLEEIESELIKTGRWEGKLLHQTRNGGQVVVESRWIFDSTEQPGKIIEVNAPFDGPTADRSTERANRSKVLKKRWGGGQRLHNWANFILAGGAFFVLLTIILYSYFGHDIIKAIYDGKLFRLDEWIMQGKRTTSLPDYYAAADQAIVKFVLVLLVFIPLSFILLKKPLGTVLMACSAFVFSFLLYGLLELVPSLIVPLKVDAVSTYYAYKAHYIPDDRLGWRRKPLSRIQTEHFQQFNYSPLYNIQVPQMSLDWQTDENGFRNTSLQNSYNVIVVGDSYMDFGESESDTFPKRLENHLDGLTVLNLGSAGYGPFQYLEVLKGYGLAKDPRYALFSFYSGNDIGDITKYLRWRQGRSEPMYSSGDVSFWSGYATMLEDFGSNLKTIALTATRLFFDRVGITGGYPYIRPEIAVVDLGRNRRHEILFVDLNELASPEEISAWDTWRHLERILAEFKSICLKNGIKPVAVYVPSATSIYARYTTNESGKGWRAIRDRQVAAQSNMEVAFARLARDLGIELINLSRVFRGAAEEGKMLFYPLDSHWNAEGRELAARYVAQQLRQIRPIDESQQADRKGSPDPRTPGKAP